MSEINYLGFVECESGVSYRIYRDLDYYFVEICVSGVWSVRAQYLVKIVEAKGYSAVSLLQRMCAIYESGGPYKAYGPGWPKPDWKKKPRKQQPASQPDPAPQPSAPLPLQPPPAAASKAALAGQPVMANRRQIAISFN